MKQNSHVLIKMKVVQANVQSLKKNKEEILRVLNDINYDIGVFSETWTRPGEEASRAYRISGYHQILAARSDGYGGVGVYVHMKYNYQQIDVSVQSEQIQIIAVNVMKLA